MAAAAPSTTSKLLNLGRSSFLQSFVRRNTLRSNAATPITRPLTSPREAQIPTLNILSGSEMLKQKKLDMGFSIGMMGLPGIDQSGRDLMVRGTGPDAAAVDDDNMDYDDDFGDHSFDGSDDDVCYSAVDGSDSD